MVLHDPTIRGPHHPVAGTPPLVAGAVRRTTCIDSTSPAGWAGPVAVRARARDATSGGPLAAAALTAVVDRATRRLLELRTDPPVGALAGLVGVAVAGGFRARLAACLAPSSLLYPLLDDLPGASLVAGYAMLRDDAIPAGRSPQLERAVDQCAGWAADGSMVVTIRREGRNPTPIGPPAPSLGDDPTAWGALPPLPAHGMRRVRRIDVLPSDGPLRRVDAFFRDSHMGPDGAESVVHEYGVDVTIDTDRMVVVGAEAVAHVLPWLECPAAVASAGRTAGVALADLRDMVRAELVGTTTCTHLNDTLRSLADVTYLLTSGGSGG